MRTGEALVLIRGGGDLASGVALRLHRAHFKIIMTEVARPLAVRRAVSFAEAIYQGAWEIEGVVADHVEDVRAVQRALAEGHIPIVVDPDAALIQEHHPSVVIDGRMLKRPSDLGVSAAPLMIGLGPGFTVGVDCHAVVETKRGHYLGRVYWEGSAQANTGIPDPVAGYDLERVIRAPVGGELIGGLAIGSLVESGDQIARIGDVPVLANFDGALRGLLHDGLQVEAGLKIGDLDPRADQEYCFKVSDKALSVGGGVLEALISQGILPTGRT